MLANINGHRSLWKDCVIYINSQSDMKITKIFIRKSKTVETAGLLGRDAFRKVDIGSECEVADGEDAVAAKEELVAFIDLAIAIEVQKFNEEIKERKKGI